MKRFLNCLLWLSLIWIGVGSVSVADIWDETINGGGDAGEFPALSGFQTTTSVTVFDTITGNLDASADPDRDGFLITVNDATSFSAETVLTGGTNDENNTRLWLFDLAGNVALANDDNPFSNDTFSLLQDPATWLSNGGNTIDNPDSLVNGNQYVLVIGGAATDPEDANGVDLANIGADLDGLIGANPAAGAFSAWENFITGGGDYQINLTGAQFGQAVPEPSSTVVLALGTVGLMARRKRSFDHG